MPNESAPLLRLIDGRPMTTSLEVAERFSRRHSTVLHAIQRLDCSRDFIEHNFLLNEYIDSIGRKLPLYHLTRDGFSYLCMGFTGREAAIWKERYIDAFNRMEAELSSRTPSRNGSGGQVRELLALLIDTMEQMAGRIDQLERRVGGGIDMKLALELYGDLDLFPLSSRRRPRKTTP